MWGVILVGCLAALVAGTVWPALAIVFGEVLNVFSRPSSEVLAGTHPWGATYLALGVVAAIAVLVKVRFCSLVLLLFLANPMNHSCTTFESWRSFTISECHIYNLR